MKEECLCGRKVIKKFKINNGKEICLCPLCSYEITMQTVLLNYSKEYMRILKGAIKCRMENVQWNE